MESDGITFQAVLFIIFNISAFIMSLVSLIITIDNKNRLDINEEIEKQVKETKLEEKISEDELEKNLENIEKETFVNSDKRDYMNLNFPKMGDASKTGVYQTLGRECKSGLNKCFTEGPTGNKHYYCSENCNIDRHNIRGRKVEEPMDWFVRFS